MNRINVLYPIVCLLLIAGCAPTPAQQEQMTATAMTATAAAWTPTPSHTPTLTPTLTSTATRTASPTSTITPAPSATPSQTPDPNHYSAPDGTFSLIAPPGWQPAEKGLEYPVLEEPQENRLRENIAFIEISSPFPMAFYSATFQDMLSQKFPGVIQKQEDFLTTKDGSEYFRWEITVPINGVNTRQIYYFYESGDWKLIAKYSSAAASKSPNIALVDQAMETVTFQH